MKTIGFFSNRHGIGNSTLIYHLAAMLAEKGEKCLLVDLDRQAGLSSLFFSQKKWFEILGKEVERETIFQSILPFLPGKGVNSEVKIHDVGENLGLIAGDYSLPYFEETLNSSWQSCLEGDLQNINSLVSFHTSIQQAGTSFNADICLIDLGSEFSAATRSGFIASDFIVSPIGLTPFLHADFMVQFPELVKWNGQWAIISNQIRSSIQNLPGETHTLGVFLMQQYSGRKINPEGLTNKAKDLWEKGIQRAISEIASEDLNSHYVDMGTFLGLSKYYFSLMDLARVYRKPVFQLTPANGAIGSQAQAVLSARSDIELLLNSMLTRIEDIIGI